MLKHDPVLDCTLGEVRLTCACQTLRGARTWANNINDATAKINALKKIDTAIANAEANAAVAASTTKALGAFGASTYMIGGTFGIIDIGTSNQGTKRFPQTALSALRPSVIS